MNPSLSAPGIKFEDYSKDETKTEEQQKDNDLLNLCHSEDGTQRRFYTAFTIFSFLSLLDCVANLREKLGENTIVICLTIDSLSVDIFTLTLLSSN